LNDSTEKKGRWGRKNQKTNKNHPNPPRRQREATKLAEIGGKTALKKAKSEERTKKKKNMTSEKNNFLKKGFERTAPKATRRSALTKVQGKKRNQLKETKKR